MLKSFCVSYFTEYKETPLQKIEYKILKIGTIGGTEKNFSVWYKMKKTEKIYIISNANNLYVYGKKFET